MGLASGKEVGVSTGEVEGAFGTPPRDWGGRGADADSGREAGRDEGVVAALPVEWWLWLLTPPPKSLSLWAMMPGMAMSSSGDRIS